MIYVLLFIEFFKIGLLAIGGGYATLPFLYTLSEQYQWFSAKELTDMIAISNITPGPVGINVATFAGYKTAGLLGGIIATTAIVLPALIIIMIIANFLDKYKENKIIQSLFSGLKPAACALLAGICVKLFSEIIINGDKIMTNNVDYKSITIFILLMLISLKTKKNPILLILYGAVAGILININLF